MLHEASGGSVLVLTVDRVQSRMSINLTLFSPVVYISPPTSRIWLRRWLAGPEEVYGTRFILGHTRVDDVYATCMVVIGWKR